MLIRHRRRYLLALAGLICLSQGAADCSRAGGQVRYQLGYAEVAGKPAVYAPLCPDDEVRGVRVYAAPDPDKGGNFTLLWQAETPRVDAARKGLVVLGDDSQFETVKLAPPASFPRRLSVSVDTVSGAGPSENREHSADLPDYPAGTPLAEMTFETAGGSRSAEQVRRFVEDQHPCG
ncbi:hypothetical protein AB0J86_24455 [Micromonospora sp. NPDC049559]|uniref:hypothetical protein n=1 Tax=Micromonospora sp. NPDC049559 TaxID=3155923 RepID=UPI00344A4695